MTERPFRLHQGTKPRGAGLPMHAHGEAQLTFAASGVTQVHTGAGRWLVPPQLAAWIPVGVPHRVEVLTDAELWVVHWQPSALLAWAPPALPGRTFALRVTPPLRTLLTTAFAAETSAETDPGKIELVIRLMLHELTAIADAPTFLPLPTSPLGQRVADLAFGDHQNRLSVGELASRAATSVCTVSLLFPYRSARALRLA